MASEIRCLSRLAVVMLLVLVGCAAMPGQGKVLERSAERMVYTGVTGETALDTLRRLVPITTRRAEFGEFLFAIDGVEGDGVGRFWAFLVNGEMSRQGAGDYVAQPGDLFEWQLRSRQPAP